MESVTKQISSFLNVDEKEASLIITKAIVGGETDKDHLQEWYDDRFLPNTVLIDEDGYAEMCIDSLKIIGTTAATDYGSSRQRDLGQMWADSIRGYLGELAFQLFLKKTFLIDIELGHEQGVLDEYLPTDIHSIKGVDGAKRKPKINISIKATKWNGIWLDIPGEQFNHSAAHIFIKVGVGRDHLFAYFKKISVFKDKVLRIGKEMGSLSELEANTIYDTLPTFKPIPAYIDGFALNSPGLKPLSYGGKRGRLNYTITSWNGPIVPGDLDAIKNKEGIGGKVQFEGIGKFSHDKGYLFNAGSLWWKRSDWRKLISKL